MGTKYIRMRTLIEVSEQSDYGRAEKYQHEDTWSDTNLFKYDGPVTDAAQTIYLADQFTTINKVFIANTHATVAFELTITIDGSAITMNLGVGESATFDDVSDANLTVNGDAAASSCLVLAWGT